MGARMHRRFLGSRTATPITFESPGTLGDNLTRGSTYRAAPTQAPRASYKSALILGTSGRLVAVGWPGAWGSKV